MARVKVATVRQVLDWMIGFIDTLYIPFRNTINYSVVADLHTLQFTVTHALGFSVFMILSLQRIYNSRTVTAAHIKSFSTA
jgi:hypothetical protein